MSTQFGRLFSRVGVGPLLSNFAESVVYIPKVGTQRTIMAIIERDVELFDAGVPVRADIMRVKNDSETGVSSMEIETSGDQVQYSIREGDTPVTKRIAVVVSTDNGVVQFRMK